MSKAVVTGVGIVAALGVAYLGATAWTGAQVQTRYEQQIAKIQAQFPFIKISESQYEKGFFKSTSTVTIQLGCDVEAGSDRKPVLIVVKDMIQHGPLPGGASLAAAVVDSEIVLPPDAQQAVTKIFGTAKPFTMRTSVGFGGDTVSRISSPAAKMDGPEGEVMTWQGLSATLRGDSAMKTFKYELALPGITVTDAKKGMTMQLSALQLTGDGTAVTEAGLLKVGKDEGSIASIGVTVVAAPGAKDAKPTKVEFSNLKFSSQSAVENDLVSSTVQMTGAGMLGESKLENLELQGSMRRIHAPTYERMMTNILQSSAACYSGKNKSGGSPEAVLEQTQKDMAALLPFNPEYSVDKLAADFGGKRGEISHSVGINGATAEDAKLPATAMLMTRGRIKADFKLPVDWITQLAEHVASRSGGMTPDAKGVNLMIDQAAGQGFVVRDGEFIKTSMVFNKGEFTVNGNALPMFGK